MQRITLRYYKGVFWIFSKAYAFFGKKLKVTT